MLSSAILFMLRFESKYIDFCNPLRLENNAAKMIKIS